jgi:hypothetical protein
VPASPAEAYDRHVGRYGTQLASGLIEAAGVKSGWRALDVGCGPGPLTRALADLLGQQNVAAVDPSEPFVEACRERVVVAASVWDYNAMPLLRSFWDSALEVAPERAGKLDGGQRVGYEMPDELAELWIDQGLRDVSTGEIVAEATYSDFDDLFTPFASGVGHSGGCFTALDGAAQERVRRETHERLGRPQGPFTLSSRAWWVRGIAGG